LTEILAEEGCVSERKAALILFQILNVLTECHKNNIMHTDLKLENIAFNSK
jgi:serine/threonine protein kinase